MKIHYFRKVTSPGLGSVFQKESRDLQILYCDVVKSVFLHEILGSLFDNQYLLQNQFLYNYDIYLSSFLDLVGLVEDN